MKILIRLFTIVVAVSAVPAIWAGPEENLLSPAPSKETTDVSLNLLTIDTGYVFESDLNHGGSFGRQYELQNEFEYAHRFLITGHLYLRLGLDYSRFDFGHTNAPVPVHLQSMAGVIGFDYMHENDVAAFLWVRPGFYTEDHLGISSFDAPITAGRIFVIQEDKLFVLVGAQAAFLRGGYPVIPVAGLIWTPNDKLKLMAVPPDPRLIYSATDKLDLWIGGELVGGSFRTDSDNTIVPRKLSGAQVDYEDYRAGVGLVYSPAEWVSLDLGGGCSIERGFKFHRAGENYRTDPAPYLKFEFKARF